MTTNAEIKAEYLADRQDRMTDVGWPLLVFDGFLHQHCTYKRTDQYRRYRRWIEEMIVAGVRATGRESDGEGERDDHTH